MTIKINNQDLQIKLARVRRMTFAIMVFERLWPLVLPIILVVLVFLTASWFHLFKISAGFLQIALLTGFALILCWCLIRLFKYKSPSQSEVDNRIEQVSGLAFQPILSQNDSLPATNNEVANVLWQAHRQRLMQSIDNLVSGYPHPNIPSRDPYGVRHIVILSFFIAFAYSFSPYSGRVEDAFYFGKHADWSNMRIDAWITPPAYTGRAPIYLMDKNTNSINAHRFEVPANSVMNLRISSADTRLKLNAKSPLSNGVTTTNLVPVSEIKGDVFAYDVPITQSVGFTLKGPQTNLSWQLDIIPDRAPQISWESDPKRALNGLLDLTYKIDDDYGAVKAWAVIEILSAEGKTNQMPKHSLFPVPQIALTLPRNGKGISRTSKDFSKNPWAGSRALLTLYVEDAAGNQAMSEAKELVLPQRSFGNPLARALIEQRGLLISDTANKNRVLDMLYALQIRPKDTLGNATTVITLASVKRRLSLAHDDDAFRNVVEYLWDIADGVEGGSLSAAAQRLKTAQQALRDALRNGASQDEIERLMAELKNAMSAYMDELAKSGHKLQRQPGQKIQNLSEDDLQKKLKELEELAKLGNRAAAEQLLSELEKLMDNIQVTQGEDGDRSSGSGGDSNKNSAKQKMQKNIEQLSDLLRRQQEMLNDTNKMTGEHRRGEKSDEEFSQYLEDLKKRQQDVQNDLQDLQKSLEKQGVQSNKGFDEALRAMEKSQDALNNNNGDEATQNQTDALNAMRDGAQDMMKDIREALKKQGENTGDDNLGIDPLGRKIGNESNQQDNGAIPSEGDIQRARRVLDEIRKRLGNLTPEMERNYLERLLKFD